MVALEIIAPGRDVAGERLFATGKLDDRAPERFEQLQRIMGGEMRAFTHRRSSPFSATLRFVPSRSLRGPRVAEGLPGIGCRTRSLWCRATGNAFPARR